MGANVMGYRATLSVRFGAEVEQHGEKGSEVASLP